MNEIPRPSTLTGTDRSIRSLAGRRWTTAELLTRIEAGLLDPDEEFELIHGEVVPLLRRGRCHENFRGDLAEFLIRRCPYGVRVDAAPQFSLADDTFRKSEILLRPANISGFDARGADALLVIDMDEARDNCDLTTRPKLYASFGVREYWVIAARTQVTWVHRGPSATGYASVREVSAGEVLTPALVPALTFRLDEIGQLDD